MKPELTMRDTDRRQSAPVGGREGRHLWAGGARHTATRAFYRETRRRREDQLSEGRSGRQLFLVIGPDV